MPSRRVGSSDLAKGVLGAGCCACHPGTQRFRNRSLRGVPSCATPHGGPECAAAAATRRCCRASTARGHLRSAWANFGPLAALPDAGGHDDMHERARVCSTSRAEPSQHRASAALRQRRERGRRHACLRARARSAAHARHGGAALRLCACGACVGWMVGRTPGRWGEARAPRNAARGPRRVACGARACRRLVCLSAGLRNASRSGLAGGACGWRAPTRLCSRSFLRACGWAGRRAGRPAWELARLFASCSFLVL